MSVLSRVSKKISKYGEQFTINGTTSAKGFFQLLNTGTMHTFLDDTEAATIMRPALYLTTSADTPIAEGNTIARDGKSYTVRKVALQRFGQTVVIKIAVLA